MDCLYISLDAQTERQTFLEQNFAKHKLPDWKLDRIPAIDTATVQKQKTSGKITYREKACFASHIKALNEALLRPGHTMILEDDAAFGPHSCKLIDHTVASMPPDGWDVIYSDVGFGAAHDLVDFIIMRKRFLSSKELRIVDLKKLVYYGATAYILNEKSKQKILDLMTASGAYDVPYDLFLRWQIAQGFLKGYAIFPFPTTTSSYSVKSQIQPKGTALTDFIMDAFRKIIWYDRDLAACLPAIEAQTQKITDDETKAYAALLGAMLSSQFKLK